MPVLAISTFKTSTGQLIKDYLPELHHGIANHTVASRLTRLIGRLKDKDNYFGQAGRNVYEDVSCCLSYLRAPQASTVRTCLHGPAGPNRHLKYL